MNKPTPGPYYIIEKSDGDLMVCADLPKGRVELATVHKSAEYAARLPVMANAELFVVSAEAVEALAAAINVVHSAHNAWWSDCAHPLCLAARAALKRVGG